jgi:hypothetical protein
MIKVCLIACFIQTSYLPASQGENANTAGATRELVVSDRRNIKRLTEIGYILTGMGIQLWPSRSNFKWMVGEIEHESKYQRLSRTYSRLICEILFWRCNAPSIEQREI